jgi:hypothetical protein
MDGGHGGYHLQRLDLNFMGVLTLALHSQAGANHPDRRGRISVLYDFGRPGSLHTAWISEFTRSFTWDGISVSTKERTMPVVMPRVGKPCLSIYEIG